MRAPHKVLAPAALVDVAHQRCPAERSVSVSQKVGWRTVSKCSALSGVRRSLRRVAALEQGGAAPVALLVHAALKAAQRREVHVLRRALARAERALAALAVQRLLLPARHARTG